MRIAIFVEDAAHAAFITRLVARVAAEEGVNVTIDVRNAVGGRGSVLTALRKYVRDLARGKQSFAEILVVAIDGNCQGAQDIARDIREIAEREEFPGLLVCAVPEPHIEVWYLADGYAVHRAIGVDGAQEGLPALKCEKSRYKTLLRSAFLDGDIDPPAGGSEYGEDIADLLDLERARRADEQLDAFLGDLRAAIRQSSN